MQSEILTKKKQKNVFTYFLGNDSGQLNFGGEDIMEEDTNFLKINENSNYWTLPIVEV